VDNKLEDKFCTSSNVGTWAGHGLWTLQLSPLVRPEEVVETSEILKNSNLTCPKSKFGFVKMCDVSTTILMSSSVGMKFWKMLKKLKIQIREGLISSRVQNNP
jgi:hypothetical protein